VSELSKIIRCPVCGAMLPLVGGRIPNHTPNGKGSPPWCDGSKLRVNYREDSNARPEYRPS